MNKITALLLILLVSPIIGGMYGILNDQFTYTISPEYYTKFKFYQFGLAYTGKEAIFPHPRVQVAIVGVLATWWMGLLLGLVLALTALMHENGKQMFRVVIRAIAVAVITIATTASAGLAYGWLYVSDGVVNWWLPENLSDRKHFITVGTMHNFSYAGGLIGLVAGVTYIICRSRDAGIQ